MLTFAAKQVFGKEELRKVIIFLKIPQLSFSQHTIKSQMLREEDVDSNTPLLMGIESGNVDIVSHLVEAGGDVNQCNRNRVYPLHLACTNGSLEIVKLLLHVSWRRKNGI